MSQASDHQMLQVAHCLPFSMENRKKYSFWAAHLLTTEHHETIDWCVFFLCASFPEISTKGQAIVRTCERSKTSSHPDQVEQFNGII